MLELKIRSLQELKDWLEQNYATTKSVWLDFPTKAVFAENVGEDLEFKDVSFGWAEIVDVLLCYGWIDSTARKVDHKWRSIRISPRNPKSNWSKINKDKIQKLDSLGLIHSNGQKVIDLARQNGTWNGLDDVDNLVIPPDFQEYLEKNNLLVAWHTKGRSFKRNFLEQLLGCKKSETRIKKIQTLKLR